MRPTLLRLAAQGPSRRAALKPARPRATAAPAPSAGPSTPARPPAAATSAPPLGAAKPTANPTTAADKPTAGPPSDGGVRVGLRPPRTDRTRGLMDSFRALPSNTRILVGVALGICGIAGLYLDRLVDEPEDAGADGADAGEERRLPISLRVVDRKE